MPIMTGKDVSNLKKYPQNAPLEVVRSIHGIHACAALFFGNKQYLTMHIIIRHCWPKERHCIYDEFPMTKLATSQPFRLKT